MSITNHHQTSGKCYARNAEAAIRHARLPRQQLRQRRDAMAAGVESSGHSRGRGEAGGGRGSHPQAAAAAECTAACCVLCACLPVAALCCAARAWLLLARGGARPWRARGVLVPSASSSSFSDEDIGSTGYGRRSAAAAFL